MQSQTQPHAIHFEPVRDLSSRRLRRTFSRDRCAPGFRFTAYIATAPLTHLSPGAVMASSRTTTFTASP